MVHGGVRGDEVAEDRGFTVAELLVVMGILAAVTLSASPWLISAWRAATTRAAAQELATGLSAARQLAIAKAQSVCVEIAAGNYRYRLGGCAGPVWMGPGTGPNGFFRLSSGATVAANANPVFDDLGAATPAATLTVASAQGAEARTITVSGSGRIHVQ